MSLRSKFQNWIEDSIIRKSPDSKILVEAFKRRGVDQNLSLKIEKVANTPMEQTLDKWKSAVALATDPDYPDRGPLQLLYENLMLDNHLASVIDSRILFCQRSAFKFVDDNDKENKEISWLFERPWFDELIYKVIMSKFKGTSLIEFYELTVDGEIAEIEEIPQGNFNPFKGIVIKTPGETTGWDYKFGQAANYYLQVGKNNELGMLHQLAPIVLAKKLGLGSWLDYIERFGVPPIFVKTDREDAKRFNELYDMAINFKSNQVVVGRGAETIEFGEIGGAGTAPFDSLMTRADEQISKRILGGSGLTDEKAFVGSSEIQFRLMKDRYESDKLFFKYIFNTEIKPRLMKISEKYSVLANYYFDWDNTESLNQKEIIDTIAKLGVMYEIDPDYITKITGIPVIGTKNIGPAGTLPGGGVLGK